MSLFGDATNFITGGANSTASGDEQKAIEALAQLQTPTQEQLSLPELQQYAAAVGMSPAQMQAFLQQNNALATENTPQTGTDAQIAALNQLSGVANAGANGTPVEQAQIAQALEQSNQNLAGQRGAIDQAAEARGVPPGLLQAALAQQNAGQDAQNANQSALQAQSQAYQTALNAMTGGANAGQALQGQQNTQANTVAQAQNAMQQFNAANQQNAAANNAGFQQAANATNTQNANQINSANTGLANQRTQYNAQVPQQIFNDQLQKATGTANQENNAANNATGQGQQSAGLFSGLLGAGATALGGPVAGAMVGNGGQPIGGGNSSPNSGTANANPQTYGINQAHGGIIPEMKAGGMIPGKAKVAGDSTANDTVPIKVSPGEAVIPRSQVQQNPIDVMRLLAGKGGPPQGAPMPQPGMPPQPPAGHHPQDIAALLAAMKHLRGTK